MTKLTRKQRLDLLDYEREIEDQQRAEAEAEASEGLAFLQKRFRHQKDRVWTPSDAACDSPPCILRPVGSFCRRGILNQIPPSST